MNCTMKQKFLLVCVLLALNIYVDASTERGSATINDAADANPKTPTFGQAHRDDGSEYQKKVLKSVQENLLARFNDAASSIEKEEEEEEKGVDPPVQKYKKNEEVETNLAKQKKFLTKYTKVLNKCAILRKQVPPTYYCKLINNDFVPTKYQNDREKVNKLDCCKRQKQEHALADAVEKAKIDAEVKKAIDHQQLSDKGFDKSGAEAIEKTKKKYKEVEKLVDNLTEFLKRYIPAEFEKKMKKIFAQMDDYLATFVTLKSILPHHKKDLISKFKIAINKNIKDASTTIPKYDKTLTEIIEKFAKAIDGK